MFGSVGAPELLVVAIVGLIVLGPERLPHYAKEAGRILRNLRRLADDATADLKAELGPELADLDVRDLHPKTMLRKFMEEDDTTRAAAPAMVHPNFPQPQQASPLSGGAGQDGLGQESSGQLSAGPGAAAGPAANYDDIT